jgi:hypothetical protein
VESIDVVCAVHCAKTINPSTLGRRQ